MSVNLKKYESKDLTSFTITGEITVQELSGILVQYLESGSTRCRVFDITEGEIKDLKSIHFDSIAEWIKSNDDKRPAGTKTAFIVSKDADYDTIKLFYMMAAIEGKTWDARMFHSLIEAYQWLNVLPEEP